MKVFWVSKGKPVGPLSQIDEREYEEANTVFLGVVLGVLVEHLQDVYMRHTVAKDLWNSLEAEYGGSDVGTELYIMEQHHDYKMIDEKSVVK